jgi:uncharacterized membrane protein
MTEALAAAAPIAAPRLLVRVAQAIRRVAASLLTWPRLVAWYVVAIVVGSLGSYFAYTPPLTSDAWRKWYPIRNPWAVDALRLLIAALLALFILWALGALDRHNDRLRERILRGWVVLIPVAILLASLGMTFGYLPQKFIAELAARRWRGLITFRTIYLPYFPYAAYTMALWFGVVMPPFVVILFRLRMDFQRWRRYRAEFESAFAALPIMKPSEDVLVRAQVALQNYIVRLKQVGERSLPVILAVAAILVYEQTTPSRNTALHETQSWAKVALWFLMGPAVITCLTIVTFGYQGAIRTAEGIYRRLLAHGWGDAKLQATLLKAREDLMWKGNGGTFVLSIFKSTSVLLVFIGSGTAYVVKTVNGENGWWGIFIPDAVFHFVKHIFS